jgi:hypothetical protein
MIDHESQLCLKTRSRWTGQLILSRKEAQKAQKSAEAICAFCASLWHRDF